MMIPTHWPIEMDLLMVELEHSPLMTRELLQIVIMIKSLLMISLAIMPSSI